MKNRMIFKESFLDGFTMAGFFGRLEQPDATTALCVTSQTMLLLPNLLDDDAKGKAHVYNIFARVCGAASFLATLGACVYLVASHHEAAAGAVLGTVVLATIGRMVR